jgi:ABC-type uncharacterized transport system permease subunit
VSTAAFCRIAGGILVLLVGAAMGAGGLQLWRGGPEAWPDMIASETTVRRTSAGMIVIAALVLIAGAAAAGNAPWGAFAAGVGTIVVVIAAFWVNHLLFGSIRPLHTVTNVVVAAIILALLWTGDSGRAR